MDLESDLKAFSSGDRDKIEKELNADLKSVDKGGNDDEQLMDKDSISGKRKRECYMGMLSWIVNVAKDPNNRAIGLLPESHKWKNYGSEVPWKQILMAREAMLLKENVDGSSEQSYWQKKQKMHPRLYDDQSCSERLRQSQRLLITKDSSRKPREPEPTSSNSLTNDDNNEPHSTAESYTFWFSSRRQKQVPISPLFQANLPQFQGNDYESDCQWLGTQVWPLHKNEQIKSVLIERDRIGKGREESCGCQLRGSVECVKFHILEKRKKIKLELGWAFYKWRFDNMGDEVALFWKRDEEIKFEEIVKSNSLSENSKSFWDGLFEFFSEKGREFLVSYYFNVFLLRRRARQNRIGDSEIDSDDEESEFGPVGNRFGQLAANTPGSIFCSPKKSKKKR